MVRQYWKHHKRAEGKIVILGEYTQKLNVEFYSPINLIEIFLNLYFKINRSSK